MKIGVIGAGGWGTALSVVLNRRQHQVSLWVRRKEQAEELKEKRENVQYLPGIKLAENIEITTDLQYVSQNELVFLVVPSAYILEVGALLPKNLPIISCAKGLSRDFKRLSQALAEQGFNKIAVLSGPNHAEEIARGLPAATVIASLDLDLAKAAQQALVGPELRVYTSDDVAGVEFGAALKNVIAIAAGMIDGSALGDNIKAVLITRGLREMVRFAKANGAREQTLYGLAGLGDLITTCFSQYSRNRAAGERLVRGQPASIGPQVVEGLFAAQRLSVWADEIGFDLPIVKTVNAIAQGQINPAEGLTQLMGRAAKAEFDEFKM